MGALSGAGRKAPRLRRHCNDFGECAMTDLECGSRAGRA